MDIVLTFTHDHDLNDVLSNTFRLHTNRVYTLTLTGANSAWPTNVTLYLEAGYNSNNMKVFGTYTADLAETRMPLITDSNLLFRFRASIPAVITGGETITATFTRYLDGVTPVLTDADGNLLLGTCLTANIPADDDFGCAPGCIIIATDGTTVAKPFCNIGTAAAANFNLITVEADGA